MPLTGAVAVRLFDDHVDAVHAAIARRVGDAAAPVVTAEAFDDATTSWRGTEPSPGAERRALLRAAVRAIGRHPDLERAHLLSCRPPRGPATSFADPLVGDPRHGAAGAPSDGVGDVEAGRLMLAVTELEPVERDVLLLSLWEGCSQGEVADVVERPAAEIRSILGDVRRRLSIAASGGRDG